MWHSISASRSGACVSVFLAASLLVGASVASSGSVGYVGLVVPHLVRLAIGSDNRRRFRRRAGRRLFVIVADTTARTVIAPRELPRRRDHGADRCAALRYSAQKRLKSKDGDEEFRISDLKNLVFSERALNA